MADDKEDGEKLFPSEKADTQTSEVLKFTPENENKNAVSSIHMETVKSKFTGLTKEELMKYAKDPFWIRIRWVLFVLFWLIWFLMLFGAIFVIMVTPKCKESPPPEWWQRSSLYKIDIFQLALENDSVIGKLISISSSRILHCMSAYSLVSVFSTLTLYRFVTETHQIFERHWCGNVNAGVCVQIQ